MNLNLTKMQGTGNDYIFANLLDVGDSEIFDEMNWSQMAIRLSDRHFGIGSDGLIFICPSDIADCRMRMFNAVGFCEVVEKMLWRTRKIEILCSRRLRGGYVWKWNTLSGKICV